MAAFRQPERVSQRRRLLFSAGPRPGDRRVPLLSLIVAQLVCYAAIFKRTLGKPEKER